MPAPLLSVLQYSAFYGTKNSCCVVKIYCWQGTQAVGSLHFWSHEFPPENCKASSRGKGSRDFLISYFVIFCFYVCGSNPLGMEDGRACAGSPESSIPTSFCLTGQQGMARCVLCTSADVSWRFNCPAIVPSVQRLVILVGTKKLKKKGSFN